MSLFTTESPLGVGMNNTTNGKEDEESKEEVEEDEEGDRIDAHPICKKYADKERNIHFVTIATAPQSDETHPVPVLYYI